MNFMDFYNPVAERYRLTLKMRLHILMHRSSWAPYELSQSQCMSLGFLSGERGTYYVYNNIVSRCGNVIKFKNNCQMDSSVNTRYSFLL